MSRASQALRIAEDIEADFPEHAATLRSWNFGKRPKDPKIQARNLKWARMKAAHDRRVEAGEDEDDVLWDVMKSHGLDPEHEDDWDLAVEIVEGKWVPVNELAKKLRANEGPLDT